MTPSWLVFLIEGFPDSAPAHLESILDELEECDNAASIIQNVVKEDAGWLSILLRQKCAAEREQANVLVEAELEVCIFIVMKVSSLQLNLDFNSSASGP